MKTEKEINDDRARELIQMLANAVKTHGDCGGHHKAAQNERLISEYKKELFELDEPVPNDDFLYEIGIFNSNGSY